MNPAGQPGQMGSGQPNGQPQQRPPFPFQPSDMDRLPIPDADKVKYKMGLTGLYRSMNSSPPDTQQHQEASRKIRDFSAQLATKIRNMRAPSQASSTGGAQGSQGPPATQAPGEQSMAASAGGPAAAAAAAAAAAGGQPGTAPGAAGANAQGQQAQQGNRPQNLVMTAQIRQHTTDTVAHAPQSVVDQGGEAQWLSTRRETYGTAVVKMQQASNWIRDNEPKLRALQQKGAAMSPDEQRVMQELGPKYQQAVAQRQRCQPIIDQIRKEQVSIKEARGPSNGSASDVPANPAARPGQQAGNNASVPQPDSAAEAPKAQPSGAADRMPGASAQAGQQPPRASPVTAAQSAPAQQIKIEPGMSQPQVPPPVSTAIASAATAGMPSAGTPTQNTARMPPTPIQTATPTTSGAPSLSHSAALNRANSHRASQQAGIANQNQLQGTPQGAGGTPLSAGVMGSTAQQPGHPHAHPGQQQPQTSIPTKLPIAKILPEKAAMTPQPVSTSNGGVPPGRPTYTGGGGTAGGVMGQPILPKIPHIQMEGEGERVLNRKKLDDLVRQVCGGQAEGQEGNTLTPDVEEAVLTMADSFVDSLLHSACAIAKARGSKVLEIRDIQLVLERTYNIRIPGYATDELRAVRKVQPAVGWLTKISAIQASKVTGNKEF
ncbi:unnamed protein product [Discula destructiva]